MNGQICLGKASSLQKGDDCICALAQFLVYLAYVISRRAIDYGPGCDAGRDFSLGESFNRDCSAVATSSRNSISNKKAARRQANTEEQGGKEKGKGN